MHEANSPCVSDGDDVQETLVVEYLIDHEREDVNDGYGIDVECDETDEERDERHDRCRERFYPLGHEMHVQPIFF